MKFVTSFGVWCSLLVALPGSAQLAEIDATKLPQTADVQGAYRSALGAERYAQSWSDPWSYPVPKADVVKTLTGSLATLEKAGKSAADNHELQLATGLVAHFAYNLDVEAAYDPAIEFLTKAAQANSTDMRGGWFLGIHECQSLHIISGMNRLLAVEASGKALPADFWSDYIACANVAIMPAHALRAIDRAVELGNLREGYRNVQEIGESRYKTADLSKPINEYDAWRSEDLQGGRLKFISRLCGISFVANGSWGLGILPVSDETCKADLTPPAAKKGQPSSTILVMARMAKEGETLDSFARGLLQNATAGLSDLSSSPCPVEHCVSLELVDKNIYSKQGGAHALLVTFERPIPQYDGLLFETPQEPPATGKVNTPVAFRFALQYRRMPGKIFYAVLLDANAQIFDRGKADWEAVVKSVATE